MTPKQIKELQIAGLFSPITPPLQKFKPKIISPSGSGKINEIKFNYSGGLQYHQVTKYDFFFDKVSIAPNNCEYSLCKSSPKANHLHLQHVTDDFVSIYGRGTSSGQSSLALDHFTLNRDITLKIMPGPDEEVSIFPSQISIVYYSINESRIRAVIEYLNKVKVAK